jgi:hypothetical protein
MLILSEKIDDFEDEMCLAPLLENWNYNEIITDV